ncbi:hypothetical protein THIOM_003125 [Candidatus Thiomargarita nelsonii]|uniref:Uncharacterized protein n=1 Tax=Candidatus Thiomargarita nelsonii TaxID=1003181 RepID=A0A176RZG6_9GAMM|nr:hypothetical protein THIOM_003125 [Candidatus Thiomargarita nelsonii]
MLLGKPIKRSVSISASGKSSIISFFVSKRLPSTANIALFISPTPFIRINIQTPIGRGRK